MTYPRTRRDRYGPPQQRPPTHRPPAHPVYAPRAQYRHPQPPAYGYPPPWPAYPPVPPRPLTNVAAIISISAGVLAVLFNILFVPGVIAVIAGLVGHRQALKEGRGLAKLALGGMLLGLIALSAVLLRVVT